MGRAGAKKPRYSPVLWRYLSGADLQTPPCCAVKGRFLNVVTMHSPSSGLCDSEKPSNYWSGRKRNAVGQRRLGGRPGPGLLAQHRGGK